MAHRTFRDRHGMQWEAWDVIPLRAERRREDRRALTNRHAAAMRASVERRTAPDRRVTRDQHRVHVGQGLERGWLVFESRLERRRLIPIPPQWDALPDTALDDLCGRATSLSTGPRRLID